jgi:hypothetical protein
MKPDIAAPGVSICSAISSFTDAAYTTVQSINFNNKTYDFAKFSGTSMSGPVVAGICALVLQANPLLSAHQVKEIIQTTARQDNFTGVIPSEGSPLWGKGKVNAYAAVQEALEMTALPENVLDNSWSIYPNPVIEILHFTLIEELPQTCTIIDECGERFELPILHEKVNVKQLAPGKYIMQILLNGILQTKAFVKVS